MVVLGLNPDVVVLQEAGRDPSIYREVCWQVYCDCVRLRVARLNPVKRRSSALMKLLR